MSNPNLQTLAEDVNAFMKEHLKPELVAEVIGAANNGHVSENERNDAITKSVCDVVAFMLAANIREIYEDKVDGLESDLMEAVKVAFNHGAEEWTRLNYPQWIKRLEAGKKA